MLLLKFHEQPRKSVPSARAANCKIVRVEPAVIRVSPIIERRAAAAHLIAHPRLRGEVPIGRAQLR
jgi:hypothetical protein